MTKTSTPQADTLRELVCRVKLLRQKRLSPDDVNKYEQDWDNLLDYAMDAHDKALVLMLFSIHPHPPVVHTYCS